MISKIRNSALRHKKNEPSRFITITHDHSDSTRFSSSSKASCAECVFISIPKVNCVFGELQKKHIYQVTWVLGITGALRNNPVSPAGFELLTARAKVIPSIKAHEQIKSAVAMAVDALAKKQIRTFFIPDRVHE